MVTRVNCRCCCCADCCRLAPLPTIPARQRQPFPSPALLCLWVVPPPPFFVIASISDHKDMVSYEHRFGDCLHVAADSTWHVCGSWFDWSSMHGKSDGKSVISNCNNECRAVHRAGIIMFVGCAIL